MNDGVATRGRGMLRPGLRRVDRHTEVAVGDEEPRLERLPLEAGADLEDTAAHSHERALGGQELRAPEHRLGVGELALLDEADGEGRELDRGPLLRAARERDAGIVKCAGHVGHEGSGNGFTAPSEHEGVQGFSWSNAG